MQRRDRSPGLGAHVVLVMAITLTTAVCAAQPRQGASPAPSDSDANTCLACHRGLPDARLRVVAEEFEASVHRDERIGCSGCHGGAPTDPTVAAHDADAGFVVRPSHAKIGDICGGCHEDPMFVRRFDAAVPTDQRKLFELSRHGKLAKAGDERAPTCTSCHGVHAIEHVASPLASVHEGHVVELCAKCHADPKHMAPFGLDTDQVDAWKRSVHGQAFARGNRQAPTCKGCHSPHAGKLPGAAAVEALCDQCHAHERDLFLESPHAKAFRRLGLGECVPCHGSHAVGPPSGLGAMAPGSACEKCHATDAKPREVAESIGARLAVLDQRIDDVAAALAVAEREGLTVPPATDGLVEARSVRLELSATVHVLDAARIGSDARVAEPVLARALDAVEQARAARAAERRGFVIAMLVAVVLLGLLVAKSVQIARRRSGSP